VIRAELGVFWALVLFIAFWPTLNAYTREHRNALAIIVLNSLTVFVGVSR
jgi:predicted PurR-regulated permease PerM